MHKIEKDLKQILKGDVCFDQVTRLAYSRGASIYQMQPLGVVRPRDKSDVLALVKYAASVSMPLIPRGACSSLAGQAIGSGLVVDFTKYMNQIIEMDNYRVRIQPGVVLARLNNNLKPFHKFFPPDPASANFCTLGGMLANNSSGSHSVKYGVTKDYVNSLEIVWANGELQLDNQLKQTLFNLIKQNKTLITQHTPKVKKNSSGYNLINALKDDAIDLNQLIVSSEGTLGIITEAELRVVDLPEVNMVGLLSLDSLEQLGEVIEDLRGLEPAAIELMDSIFLRLAVEIEPRLKAILPEIPLGLLLFELDGAGCMERMEGIKQRYNKHLLYLTDDKREQEGLWQLRRAAMPIINRYKGKKRPLPFVEDIIVPIAALSRCIVSLHQLFRGYGLEVCIYGHAGDGNLHMRPQIDLKDTLELKRMQGMADQVYDLVISLGGSISAEHGDGMLRVPYLSQQYGSLIEIFRQVKQLLDPQSILNPGKIIGQETSFIHHTIYSPETQYVCISPELDQEVVHQGIEMCHGCGQCNAVCPLFELHLEEEKSPRAKATLLKAIISGQIKADKMVKELIELCLSCNSCLRECPSGVNLPYLCLKARSSLRHKWERLTTIDPYLIGQTASVAALAKSVVDNRLGRIILEYLFGIDRKRELPLPVSKTLSRTKPKRRIPSKTRHKIAYFYGCWVNFYAPNVGQSLINLLDMVDTQVILPAQGCCGAPLIYRGDLHRGYERAKQTIASLDRSIEEGCQIVTTCPTCNLMLKQGYSQLFFTEQVERIAEHTIDLYQYLLNLHQEIGLPLKELCSKAVYHQPCHLRSLIKNNDPIIQLLALVPELKLIGINDHCCGMGGTFGLSRGHFDFSMSIGEPLFNQIRGSQPEMVITTCGACRMQIEQATPWPVIHPVELLQT